MSLTKQKASGFQRIITEDESRFFLYHPRVSVWAASRDELLQRIKQITDTEKCLVSIFWLVNRIHILLDGSKWTTYSRPFFTDAVMPSLIENVQLRAHHKRLQGWLIPRDNARPHPTRQFIHP
jgi:hypothetical protein